MSSSLRTNFLKAVLVVVMALPAIGSANDGIDDALNQCASIDGDAERLECFDALAAAVDAGEYADNDAGTVAATVPTEPVPITDDVGRERVEGGRDVSQEQRFTAQVSRCQVSGQSGQTFFIFDNGQIWKQTNYRRLNFRNCDFEVEVARDAFGYEMYIPSRDRSVRVSRTR